MYVRLGIRIVVSVTIWVVQKEEGNIKNQAQSLSKCGVLLLYDYCRVLPLLALLLYCFHQGCIVAQAGSPQTLYNTWLDLCNNNMRGDT